MNPLLKTTLALGALALSSQAAAQITLYEGEGFRGRAYSTSTAVTNFDKSGLNDRTSSVVIDRGRWEVCEHARFEGRCVVLKRGSYDSLQQLGLENKISSIRPADNRRQYEREVDAQLETPNYEYRRRANERVYEAPVTSVRAVMGAPTQRCWMERQQVSGGNNNVGGALAGALIGGVLGHQVGGGSGKKAATAVGAVGGAVVGNNMAGGSTTSTRDVQRCENTVSGTPAYWDVTYNYRGQDHQIQMSAPPGTTIAVNRNGEPRQ